MKREHFLLLDTALEGPLVVEEDQDGPIGVLHTTTTVGIGPFVDSLVRPSDPTRAVERKSL